MTHIYRTKATSELKPFVGVLNDNTVVGCSKWRTAVPVAVLHVNFTSVYTIHSYAFTLTNTYRELTKTKYFYQHKIDLFVSWKIGNETVSYFKYLLCVTNNNNAPTKCTSLLTSTSFEVS